jgi:hypothetical protein
MVRRLGCVWVALGCWLLAANAWADRPTAPYLLPESTLAYARIGDVPTLLERIKETSLGRMASDKDMQPLVEQLYGSAQNAWTQIEDRVGLPLNELLQVPQGEVCLAFVAIPDQQPGVVLIFDIKDQAERAEKLLAKGEELLADRGVTKASDEIAGQQVSIYTGPDGNGICRFEREGTLVVSTSRELTRLVVLAWDGKAEKTLVDNAKFTSIMSRCGGAVDDPPQITFFVDPVETFRMLARGSSAAITLALLPVLGLDGVLGVGGSITLASGEFDRIQHIHLLLENPRAGVVQLLAMKSADTTPEPWVPHDVVSYMTINWDFQYTFDQGAVLYNSLMDEGALQAEVQRNVSERLGADFEKEILPALEGRVTLVNWVERPVKINTIANLIGIRLKDPAAFQPTLEKILARFEDRVEMKSFGGQTYWTIDAPEPRFQRNLSEIDREALAPPDPCVAILGNYLLITDRASALIEAVKTAAEPELSLAGELDYKLIASKIKRQVGGDAPGFVQFNRPEEGMRFWYDLATADDTRGRMERRAKNSVLFRDLDQALTDNPLPPFSVLRRYLAPGGGMMVNDETGLHYMSFTLRRKMDP